MDSLLKAWDPEIAPGIPEPEPASSGQVLLRQPPARNAPGMNLGRTDFSVFKRARARLHAQRKLAASKPRTRRTLSMGQGPDDVSSGSEGSVTRVSPLASPTGSVFVQTPVPPPHNKPPPSTQELLASTAKRAEFISKQRDSDRENVSKETVVPSPTPSVSTQNTQMSQQDMFYSSLLKTLDTIKTDIGGLGERMGGVERHMQDMDSAITDTAGKLRDSTVSNLQQSNTQTDYKLKDVKISLKDCLSPSVSRNAGNKVENTVRAPITWDLMDDSRALDDYEPSEFGLPSYKRKLAAATATAEFNSEFNKTENTGYDVSGHPGLSIPLVETTADLPTDRRASMFYGAPPKAFEFTATRLPKCFTDGSNIKAKYNHFPSESIEDFIRTIKNQLRPYPIYQWIPLVRKQLGKTVEMSVQEYELSLKAGRHKVLTNEGIEIDCPDGFYAWPEFEDFLVTKYHRPLREIRVIQRALFSLKQSEKKSLEQYITEFNVLLAETTVQLPDILFKAIILYQMKSATADVLYKNKNIIKMTRQEFILKATTLDDVEHQSNSRPAQASTGTKPSGTRQTWAERKAQSKKQLGINAVKAAQQKQTVAGVEQREKKVFIDPFTQQGLALNADKSRDFCGYCKGTHWICKCPLLHKNTQT